MTFSCFSLPSWKERHMYVAHTCHFSDSLPSSHGWRRTGHLSAAGKVDSLGPVQSNQFLRRGDGGGGCESCQRSYHNNDITTVTSSSSCAPAGQPYISMDDVDRKKGSWPRPYTHTLLTRAAESTHQEHPDQEHPDQYNRVAACYARQIKAGSNDSSFQRKKCITPLYSLLGSLLSLPKPL